MTRPNDCWSILSEAELDPFANGTSACLFQAQRGVTFQVSRSRNRSIFTVNERLIKPIGTGRKQFFRQFVIPSVNHSERVLMFRRHCVQIPRFVGILSTEAGQIFRYLTLLSGHWRMTRTCRRQEGRESWVARHRGACITGCRWSTAAAGVLTCPPVLQNAWAAMPASPNSQCRRTCWTAPKRAARRGTDAHAAQFLQDPDG